MKKIPTSWPEIDKKEIKAITKVMTEGWLGLGKYVDEFENKLKKYLKLKNRYVCCVSTGSDALLMSLIIASVKRNDEVILPSLNFIAGAQSILLCGAKPVFCDVDNKTLCIDTKKAQRLISKKTKAIISVDYSGNFPDYSQLIKLKKKYNKLKIIQDAAHSFASTYNKKKVGTFSDITMFSFDPIKTITSIDGGAIIVNNLKDLYKLKSIRQLGFMIQPNVAFGNKQRIINDIKNIGMQNRMSNVHAAVGIEQLKKINRFVKKKRSLCKNYNKLFRNNKNVLPPSSDFNNVTPFIYYIRVNKYLRDKLRLFLRKNSVITGLHWSANHKYSLFKNYKKSKMNITETVCNELITLPLYYKLSFTQQKRICMLINKFFKNNEKKLLRFR